MRRLLALLLLTAACGDDDMPPCDAAEDDMESSSSNAGGSENGSESSTSGGASGCLEAYDACTASGMEHWRCIDAYVACDHEAGAAWLACFAAIDTCTYNCCPYPLGTTPEVNCSLSDEGAACRDACGLYADCDPFPDDAG